MKRIILFLILTVLITVSNEAKVKNHISSYGYFYTHLSPYGIWMEFDDGLIAWRPTIMRRGWAPYSYGRWIWTDYGWYWDSYESFGYITYHYGRWHYDDYYGWIWIPGYDWAPAWVEWRYNDDFIGWAPLPPYAVFSLNIGIHFSINFVTPYNHWHFVTYDRLCDPLLYKHYVAPKYKYRVYNESRYRNDYAYEKGRIINRGVDVDFVRSRSNQEIRTNNLRYVDNPREMERTSVAKRDLSRNGEVPAFVPSDIDLKNDRNKNFDARKIDRKSSLDVSKLQNGIRRENNNVNENDRKKNNVNTNHDRILREDNLENRHESMSTDRTKNFEQRDLDVKKKTEAKRDKRENEVRTQSPRINRNITLPKENITMRKNEVQKNDRKSEVINNEMPGSSRIENRNNNQMDDSKKRRDNGTTSRERSRIR